MGSVFLYSMGNMLIADSRNHRLCLHDFKGRFLTEVKVVQEFQKPRSQPNAQVKLDPPPKRPSGLLLDQENGDIYILNLQVGEHDHHGISDDDAFRYQGDNAVIRYSLQAD